MTTINSDMIDEIFTKTSPDVADSTEVTVLAADATRRPFVSFVRLDPSAGSMDCTVGAMVVGIHTDLYSGLVVGNKGDSVVINTGTGGGTKRYAITCGYLRIGPGEGKSGVQNS